MLFASRYLIVLSAWCILATSSQAESFSFWLNRFGGIVLETSPGRESVRVFQGNKKAEETLFQSRLKPSGENTFTTPKGTVFTLKKLSRPIHNDENREINSGDWQLTVSGEGNEFRSLIPKMPFVAFGDTGKPVYFGKRDD